MTYSLSRCPVGHRYGVGWDGTGGRAGKKTVLWCCENCLKRWDI